MPKLRLRNIALTLGRLLIYGGCGVASLYILASGYESIYNKALPLVNTLASVNLSALTTPYNLIDAQPKPSSYGQFGKPVTLAIPAASGVQRLSIVAPINDHGTWLARTSTMHVLIPTKPLNGNISTMLLYCRGGFRTISADTLPAVGSNLFVDTDQNWRYVYKISSSKAFETSYPYIPSETANSKGKLIIFCNDNDNKANDVIEADILAVQGTTQ